MRVDEERKSMDVEQRDMSYVLSAYVRLYLFQTKNEDPELITFPMFRSVPHPYKKGVMIPIEFVPGDSPIAVAIKEDGADIPEPTPESEAVADKKEESYDELKARLAEMEAELAKIRKDPTIDDLTEPPDEEHEPEPKPEESAQASQDAHKSQESLSPAKAAFAEQQAEEAPTPAPEDIIRQEQESAIGAVGEQPPPERVAQAKEPPGGALPPGTQSDYGGRRDPRDFKRIAKDLAPEKDIKEDEEIEIEKITDIPEPNKEE